MEFQDYDDGADECPFCGSEASLSVRIDPVTSIVREFVQCNHCLVKTPAYETEEKALAVWNRRGGKWKDRDPWEPTN